MHGLAILALVAPLQVPTQWGAEADFPEEPNILLVIVDDIGRDMLSVYGNRAPTACTPTLDSLAQRGMVFHNAWSNPVCSPSRAQILTGRYAFRTGVGSNAGRWQHSTGLPTAEVALPDLLPQYSTAAVGKWHLAHPTAEGEGPTHPNDTGFDYFAGSMSNLVHGPFGTNFDYYEWQKNTNGDYSVSTTYATTDTADEAIYAASTLLEPWLIVASFHAPHDPLHNPPRHLLTCSKPLGRDVDARNARKMINALDTELGRVLASIDPETIVIVIGDNGSAEEAILPPHNPLHGKGTMYEGGVGVPLIVAGPGVDHGESSNLISSTDVFATIADLTGAVNLAEDSISFVPYLIGLSTPLRDTVYAERFSPNGYDTDFEEREQAIRSDRYKLIVRNDTPDEFYDLLVDPYEEVNLMGNLSLVELRAYEALRSLLP